MVKKLWYLPNFVEGRGMKAVFSWEWLTWNSVSLSNFLMQCRHVLFEFKFVGLYEIEIQKNKSKINSVNKCKGVIKTP